MSQSLEEPEIVDLGGGVKTTGGVQKWRMVLSCLRIAKWAQLFSSPYLFLCIFNFGWGRHAYFMLALLFVMSVIAIKFFMNTFTVDAWKITFHVSFK